MGGMRRLKKRAEFLRIAAVRQSAGASGLVLQAAPRAGTEPGVGFTASRKVGNAVARNRAKRRMRALAREMLLDAARPDLDYVLIARNTTPHRPYALLRTDLIRALKRLRAWTGREETDGL